MTTYTNLVFHIVFSTKQRAPLIGRELRAPLYSYVGGVLRGERGTLLEVGGVADHVHLLARLRPDQSLADVLRRVKANTSKWINEGNRARRKFQWQVGYSAFSVSESQIPRVRSYIRNQEVHHRRRTFREELIDLLDRHAVAYDDRFLP